MSDSDQKEYLLIRLPLARLRLAERDAELLFAARESSKSAKDLERARKVFLDQERHVHELERIAADMLLREAKP